MASIFRRGKKGVWYTKYYAQGKQVSRSLNTTEERVARRRKREIEGEEANGSLIAPSKTPLVPFLQRYCEFLSTTHTRKSYKNDLSVLRVFFGPVCDALKPSGTVNTKWQTGEKSTPAPDAFVGRHVYGQYLEDITATVIEQFLSRRCREDGIAPKTANRTREVLHRMFECAIKSYGYVSLDRRYPNPAAQVQRRSEPAHTIRFLDAQQILDQLAAVRHNVAMHVAVAILIYAGLRREELTWLTTADVDLEKRLIFIRAKKIDGAAWQPKTKSNRVVPISDALFAILSKFITVRKSVWFVPSPTGRRWDPDNFSQDLRAINKAAGLAWSCLDFRHTFGSHLAQKGESLFKIATLMGNSPEICRRHYAALMPDQMHDTVEFSRPAASLGAAMRALIQVLGGGSPTSSEDERRKILEALLKVG